MIKALLFDFGRVISAAKPGSLFHLYEKELGLAPDTINTIMFDSPLWQQALVGRMTMSQFWQAIGPQLNLSSEEKIRAFQQRYFDDEKINPAMPGLLEQFAEPFRLAIVSNHPPGLHEWLAAWKIEHFFEVVICSGEEGVAKPDPAVFFLALDRLDIAASEAFFIDDTAEHVRAARALGMPAHHFTSAEELILDLKRQCAFAFELPHQCHRGSFAPSSGWNCSR